MGPLLAWSETGGYETEVDAAGAVRFHQLRRVMVYDEGTGRSWRAFDYRYPPPNSVYISPKVQVQIARTGFTIWVEDRWRTGTVQYVTFDGSETVLVEDSGIRDVLLSPSGEKAVIQLGNDSSPSGTLLFFSLPSGVESLRVESSGLDFGISLSGDGYDEETSTDLALLRWSTEEASLSTTAIIHPDVDLSTQGSWNSLQYWGDYRPGVLTLDGSLHALPEDMEERAPSPDFRHAVRWRTESGEYVAYLDESRTSFDIIEFASGRVLQTLPAEWAGTHYSRWAWGWASPTRFAWAPANSFDFDLGLPAENCSDEINVLDIHTGEVETLTGREHLARFQPPAAAERASVSCPAERIEPCSVLLDGEVVGEGRWADVIGFVELE